MTNAMAESFWSSLKRELVDDAYFATKEDARLPIFEWIIWYNNERFHSSLGYATPQASTGVVLRFRASMSSWAPVCTTAQARARRSHAVGAE